MKFTFTHFIALSILIAPHNLHSELIDSSEMQAIEAEISNVNNHLADLHVILEPIHRTVLSANVISPVVNINKKMGDHFEKDDTLIQFDNTVFENYFNKAYAALNRAEAALHAKKELFENKIASLLELKDAEASLAAAQADAVLAQRHHNNCCIKAPYKGRVASVYIKEHEWPRQTGQRVMEIIDDSTLLAKILLPSNVLPLIGMDKPLHIALNDLNQVIEAKITRIAPFIDPASSTIQIEAEIDNSKGLLIAGMTGLTIIPSKFDSESFLLMHMSEITAPYSKKEILKFSYWDYLDFQSRQKQEDTSERELLNFSYWDYLDYQSWQKPEIDFSTAGIKTIKKIQGSFSSSNSISWNEEPLKDENKLIPVGFKVSKALTIEKLPETTPGIKMATPERAQEDFEINQRSVGFKLCEDDN